ncbi:MAG: DUF167 domain-containing protein [Chloroflexi bacterium]|nr:DUF167 domain-containing protein [Chloroflexota bacterium]
MSGDPTRAVRFRVRVTPRGGRDAVEGVVVGALCLRVAAAPANGAATAAALRLIASELGVPPTTVRLIRGARSRDKMVAVDNLDREALVSRWPDLGV